MKQAIATLAVGLTLGGAALAQTTIALSNLTGLQVLRIVADQRGVTATDTRLLNLVTAPPEADFLRLCLTRTTYRALVVLANNRVPQVLATRAALEAATCKTFSTNRVQNFIDRGTVTPVVSAEDLANTIRNPSVGGGVTSDEGTAVTPTRP